MVDLALDAAARVLGWVCHCGAHCFTGSGSRDSRPHHCPDCGDGCRADERSDIADERCRGQYALSVSHDVFPVTIWLPAQMTAVAGEGQGSAAIAALISEFEASAAANTHVEVVPKAQYGSGGVVDMLLATQAAVPDRLPDLAVVDVTQIAQLMDSDLLRPVDDLAESAAASLPPALRQAVSMDDRTFGVPFEADILILAYNSSQMETPPATWQDLIADGHTLALPLRDGDGSAANAFLLQYSAAGGSWAGTPPDLDAALMATLLQSYLDAATAGTIPAKMLAAGNSQECWTWYLEGNADMCVVEAHRYALDRANPAAGAFAAVPTRDGDPATVAQAWAWVITAADTAWGRIGRAVYRRRHGIDAIVAMAARE